MTVKSLATGVAAIAIIGAAAGVTSIAPSSAAPTTHQVQPVVFGAPAPASGRYPQPLDPADVPSVGDLMGVLNGLQAPGSFTSKGYLVEGGISPIEAHIADVQFARAQAQGQLPLSFNVANIAAAGAGSATADVTASGPKIAPTTRNVTFVNQGGWKISRASAMSLLSEAGIGI